MESSVQQHQQQIDTHDSSDSAHKRTEGKRLKEGTAHSIQQNKNQLIGGDIKF